MWIYIVLGVIQGVFEWIPVSSEGIVALVSQFFLQEFNAIDIALFLHLGTFFAVLAYFWRDWREVLLLKNRELLRFLLITTLISGAVGFGLYNMVRGVAIGSALLFLTGFGLLFTAYFHRAKKRFKISSDKLAVIAGLLQGLAVIPGLSRSAATVFGLSLTKEKPAEILKISYMMSAPVVFLSSTYLFLKNPAPFSEGAWISILISFFVGLLSLKILLNISERINFFKFALIFSAICFVGAIISVIV